MKQRHRLELIPGSQDNLPWWKVWVDEEWVGLVVQLSDNKFQARTRTLTELGEFDNQSAAAQAVYDWWVGEQ